MTRIYAQLLIFTIWMTGLVAVLIVYVYAISQYQATPNVYGLADIPEWGDKIQHRFDGPLAAIYAPWIAVMIAALTGESSEKKQERVSRGLILIAAFICCVLQFFLLFILYQAMLKTKPLESQMPLGSALLALLISVVGAFVTYSFPAQPHSDNSVQLEVDEPNNKKVPAH
jgi:hypothetical protein